RTCGGRSRDSVDDILVGSSSFRRGHPACHRCPRPRPRRRHDLHLRTGAAASPGSAGGGEVTSEFKVGDVAVDLFTLRPVRVTRLREYMEEAPGTILVRFLGSDHEKWVREDDLRYLSTPNEVENVACGFCADLDGGTCVDCEG